MAVDGCGLVCQYIIIVVNSISAAVGIVFLGFGLWLRFSDGTRVIFEIQELNSSTFVIGVTVMIALGVVMLIVVTFGGFGACSENRCALQVFSCLVAILAGAEIITGILAYAYHDDVAQRIIEFYSSLYGLYTLSQDPVIAVTLTSVHKLFHCCGMTGIQLLEFVKKTCPDPNGFWENIKMPNCPITIASVMDSRAPAMLGILVGTGALLITVLICSIVLVKSIRVAVSSPQYIVLSPSTPSSNPQPPPPALSTCRSYPLDQEPVVFTPLTVANITVANIPVAHA